MERLEGRTARRLDDLDAAGLRRRLEPPRGIDLSSNDYLGLARHPVVAERMARAVLDGGCGSTGSRLLRGHRAAFAELEERFAAFKGTERALFFGSGYAANIAVLATFLEPGDLVFSDALNHASLIDGMRLGRARRVVFPHADLDALRDLVAREPATGQRFLVTESLFSMDGDVAPLAAYADLCREAGITLIVDEAHAVGVYGRDGSGLLEELGIPSAPWLSINTAGKALGVAGAWVAGPAWAIEYLAQVSRTFVFSTAPPPAVAAGLDAALDLVGAEPERRARLRALAGRLRRALGEEGAPVVAGASQIVPVVLGANEAALAVAARLREADYDVRAIRPPTVPPGTARLRISVNAALEPETLDRFARAVGAAVREVAR